MEYGKKAKDTIAYNYGNERLSYEDAKNKNKADTYTYNYDGRGSVANILDNNGTSMVEYSYNAFGETTITGTQAKKTENRYQFNSENTDSVTGLQYLRARYYDSTIGRFITKDTYEGNIYDPLTRNQYLYTNNDPVNYTDPTGHFWKELWEYGKATVKTVGNIVQSVANIIVNPTPQNVISQGIQIARNGTDNFVQAKQNIDNYNNSKSAKSTNSANARVTVGKAVQPSSNSTNIILNRPTYGAAVNSKVEKSRSIESQIKTLRQRNTFEANLLIDYLQAQMKKQCESTLNKIQIETSATIGMASSMVGGTVGFIGGVIWGVGKDIKGDGFSYGYKDFNERFVNPTLQNIRDSVSDKDAYDVGYLVGTVVPVASGIMGIADKAGKISSTIRIADTLGDVALAGTVIDSSSAMSLINSIVQASIGVGSSGTSANNRPSGSTSKREELLNKVENQKLKNTINEMYRENSTVGDGGLADAIRHELNTGELVGGKSHIIKGKERVKNLQNILENQKLNATDKMVAQELLKDLQNALGGK